MSFAGQCRWPAASEARPRRRRRVCGHSRRLDSRCLPGRIDHVRTFWEAAPCADSLASSARGSERYFAEIASAKEQLEPHASAFADFANFRGRDVLEVGFGIGVHTTAFARAGAVLTACDLTEAGVSLAREQLRLARVPGTVLVANAEQLPFPGRLVRPRVVMGRDSSHA